ncbi:MAG: hypothetical protein U1F43_22685 [Myxococcota bacterium]
MKPYAALSLFVVAITVAITLAACPDDASIDDAVDDTSGDLGDVAATCGAPPIPLTLDIAGVEQSGRDVALDFAATVTSVGDGALVLSSEGKTITISYDLGSYALPVAAGDSVDVAWRQVMPFGVAHGLALWADDGRLLFVADDGGFGTAWTYRDAATRLPEGFEVTDELVGCPVRTQTCGDSARIGLRFTHPSGGDALALPGQDALLTTGAGVTYRVVNADAERLSGQPCLDQVARKAWFILATTP